MGWLSLSTRSVSTSRTTIRKLGDIIVVEHQADVDRLRARERDDPLLGLPARRRFSRLGDGRAIARCLTEDPNLEGAEEAHLLWLDAHREDAVGDLLGEVLEQERIPRALLGRSLRRLEIERDDRDDQLLQGEAAMVVREASARLEDRGALGRDQLEITALVSELARADANAGAGRGTTPPNPTTAMQIDLLAPLGHVDLHVIALPLAEQMPVVGGDDEAADARLREALRCGAEILEDGPHDLLCDSDRQRLAGAVDLLRADEDNPRSLELFRPVFVRQLVHKPVESHLDEAVDPRRGMLHSSRAPHEHIAVDHPSKTLGRRPDGEGALRLGKERDHANAGDRRRRGDCRLDLSRRRAGALE